MEENQQVEATPAVESAEAAVEALTKEYDIDEDDFVPGGEMPDEGELGDLDEADEPEGAAAESDGAVEEPVVFSSSLLVRAQALGLTQDDLEAFGGVESAERALGVIERKELARRMTSDSVQDQQQDAAQEAIPEMSAEDIFEEVFPDVDEDMIEPSLLSGLKALTGVFSSRINSLQAELTASREQSKSVSDLLNKQHVEAFNQRFDASIEGLGDEFVPLLGSGKGFEMDHSSDQFKNRVKVIDAMSLLHGGYKARGEKIPEESAIFNSAVQMVLGDQIKASVQEKLKEKLRGRSKQFIARPSSRKASEEPLSNEAIAVRNANEKLRKMGLAFAGTAEEGDSDL